MNTKTRTDDSSTALTLSGDAIKPVIRHLKGLVGPAYLKQIESTVRSYMAWVQSEGRLRQGIVSNLEDYYAYLRSRGLRDSTARLRLSHLRKFLRRCAKDTGQLDLLPLLGLVDLPRAEIESPRRFWLSSQEARMLLKSPDTTTLVGLRDKAILGLLLGAGLRRSEVANLTWAQLDLASVPPLLLNLRTKGRVRDVPIPMQLGSTLKLWREAVERTSPDCSLEGEAKVFGSVTQGGQHLKQGLSAQAVLLVVEARCKKVELMVKNGKGEASAYRPHDLRRTFARSYYDAGGDLVDLASLLGHSSVKTTEAYIGAGYNAARMDPGKYLSYAAALDGGDGR